MLWNQTAMSVPLRPKVLAARPQLKINFRTHYRTACAAVKLASCDSDMHSCAPMCWQRLRRHCKLIYPTGANKSDGMKGEKPPSLWLFFSRIKKPNDVEIWRGRKFTPSVLTLSTLL
ncbi:hypothetical protein K443DRAFT_353395 [Laccaria amethystina LaAM-08-1]|uniref:Uncharacterized protein n=1 Tax=Laccaria amethystina LaAM-08-1 TaxID=1095629 RepID=A0A0C9YBG2_9AGAR|nr:hypothetical protein K443DRAFT_353395 [Laccaria amethystina LaAM-08-1]